MVKTLVSILLTALLILGVSLYDIYVVQSIFKTFHAAVLSLYEKTEAEVAEVEDGNAVRIYWKKHRSSLHVWIPHTAINDVDYQLNEAIGYLHEKKYEDALPKLEVLLEITEKVPAAYTVKLENIF